MKHINRLANVLTGTSLLWLYSAASRSDMEAIQQAHTASQLDFFLEMGLILLALVVSLALKRFSLAHLSYKTIYQKTQARSASSMRERRQYLTNT